MDKLTNVFHTQMLEEKQKLWQLIKEKGSAGAYDCYKQAALERQQVAEANGEPVEVTISKEGMKCLTENTRDSEEFKAQEEKVYEAFKTYYAKLLRIGADRAELANAYAKQHAFDEEVVALDRKASHLPEYSGLFEVDKTIASALENCSKEEKGFVYDIIRQNFLVKNTNGMTEEERQANISLGMKKAEYAAKNFISSSQSKDFLDAMESVAKLATVGTAAEDGTMDYGVRKKGWLGEGSDLVYTDDPLDIMRRMDKKAYAEYERINADSDNESRALDALKYMMKWYVGAVQENPKMVEEYHKQSEEYVKKTVNGQKLDTTFQDVETSGRQAFIESLKAFCLKRPGFLADILNREINSAFWKN